MSTPTIIPWDKKASITKKSLIHKCINSLTPTCVPAGTKNSLSEDFLLAKHKDTNILTMMEPFSSPAAWF